MALGARSFYKKTPRVALAASTVAALLDVFITSGPIKDVLEDDGWGIETDGVAGVSLTSPNAPNSRIVLAGVDSGTPTPTMMSELADTFATGILLSGTVHGVGGGTFDWDASTAGYTGGSVDFSGYIRALNLSGSTHVAIAYNDYGMCIQLDSASNGSWKPLFIGGLLIPADPTDVEEDGRQWFMSGAGSVSTVGLTGQAWFSATSSTSNANGIFAHGTSNGYAHSVIRAPSTGAWVPVAKSLSITTAAFSLSNTSGYIAPLPVALVRASDSSDLVGYLDGIYVMSDGRHLRAYLGNAIADDALTLAGFAFGGGITSDLDMVYFEAADHNLLKPAGPA